MKQILSAGLLLGLLVLAGCGQSAGTVQTAPGHVMEPSTPPVATADVNEVMATSDASMATDVAPMDNAEYVYVCNQSSATISVISVETLEVVATVDLSEFGFDKNAKPHHIAVEADGAHWYVSLIAAGRVLKFNRNNELMGSAEFQAPGMLALHPKEDLLFVGRSMMAVNPPQRIGMIETDDMEIEELDVFFPRPHALTVDPRGEHVYSGSLSVNQFLSMDINSGEINLERLEGDTHTLVQFAQSPDGNTMVVGGQITGQALIFDTSNPDDVKLVESIKVNGAPWHPVFTPDGKYVYFGNKQTDTVTVLDVENRKVAKVIEGNGLSQPHGIAISKDGSRVFVSNNNLSGGYMAMDMSAGGMDHSKMDHSNMDHANMDHSNMDHEKKDEEKADMKMEKKDQVGTLVVIDTASNEIVKVIELGFYPSGVGTNLH